MDIGQTFMDGSLLAFISRSACNQSSSSRPAARPRARKIWFARRRICSKSGNRNGWARYPLKHSRSCFFLFLFIIYWAGVFETETLTNLH